MGHNPTDEQAQIITDVADPAGGSLMIKAYAGTAKSTTLEMAAPGVRQPALALAFNKSIATELAPRLPGLFTVKTFNGWGYGAWTRGNRAITRWELDPGKLGKLITKMSKELKIDLMSEQWDQMRQLVSKAMQAGITPDDMGSPLNPDNETSWIELADDCWIVADDRPWMVDFARQVLAEHIVMAKNGHISFDDQVYCPTVLGGQFPQYPVIFVDESQDLNPLNHRMLELSSKPGGRLIVVGDPRQAIYAFRGADSRSMDTMRRLQNNWKDRQLTLTFRCPKAIVARQQVHAPGYRAASANAEGKFVKIKPLDQEELVAGQGWNLAKIKEISPEGSIAVLCRNNGPLMSLAFKFIRSGIGVNVLGRDIGKNLTGLLKKICPEDKTPGDIIAGAIADWSEREVSLARANGKEERVAGIQDRAESLMACLEGSGARDAQELRTVIQQLFDKTTGQVTLSSIHKAKGLEWHTVVHLDPWRIPSKYAKKAAAEGDNSQLEQEWNLLYVAETRTKNTLIEANLEDYNA